MHIPTPEYIIKTKRENGIHSINLRATKPSTSSTDSSSADVEATLNPRRATNAITATFILYCFCCLQPAA